MNMILGLDEDRLLVNVETGVKLADLHDWLGARVSRHMLLH